MSRYCKKCGNVLKEKDKFCVKCGEQVVLDSCCPNCGNKIKPGSRYCLTCGVELGTEKAQSTSTNPPVKKDSLMMIIVGILVIIILILCFFIFSHKQNGEEPKESEEPISCVAGEVWNEESQTCEKEDPKTACAAQTGYVWDENSSSCITQEIFDRNQEINSCLNSGKEWNSEKNVCEAAAIEGYKPGTYTLNYDMKIRTSPSTNSSSVTVVRKGNTVQITEVSRGSSDSSSIWGKLSDGNWICIKDSAYYYLKN